MTLICAAAAGVGSSSAIGQPYSGPGRPYTPPEQIDRAFRAIARDGGGFIYSCSEYDQESGFVCSIFYECGITATGFKDGKTATLQHWSSITAECPQELFAAQVKSILRNLFQMDVAQIKLTMGDLTGAAKALPDPLDNTNMSGRIYFGNGWGAISTARLNGGQGELRAGFNWFSSELAGSK